MASFFTSIFAVASSMSTILLLFRKALQMQRSCFYPADKLLFETVASKPPFSLMISSKLHSLKIFYRSSLVYWFAISRFSLNVDLISVGSWSIMVILCLRSLRLYSFKFRPSILTFPEETYVIFRSVLMIVDLPAPVRPTMPTFYPGWI